MGVDWKLRLDLCSQQHQLNDGAKYSIDKAQMIFS